MKVLDSEPIFLSNQDVFQLVAESKTSCRSENFQTIVVELLAYLKERPAGNVNAPQTAENISKFIKALHAKGFKLEKAEILQLVNTAPTSLAVLFALIDEADTRFTEEELEEIMSLSNEYLGFEPMPEPAN